LPDGPPSAVVIVSARTRRRRPPGPARARRLLDDPQRHLGNRGGASARGLSGARHEHLFEVIEDQHQAAARVARDTAEKIGRVLSRHRGRDAHHAGRAHQLPLEVAVTGQRHDGQLASGEDVGQPGAQHRVLPTPDGRSARSGGWRR
jgi:hypothetical protein